MRIKTLPREFIKYKFTHTQLKREGNIAIYQRAIPGLPVHWEVIKIKTRAPVSAWEGDSGYDAIEQYPGSEEWGSYGYTYKTLQDASNKFAAMVRRQGRPKPLESQMELLQ